MRRALFIMLLALLIADASGVTSLLVPETCAISTSESAPDSGCPAFCVRCTCGCCASPVVPMLPVSVANAVLRPANVPLPADQVLASGVPLDILHIPKSLQA